MENKAIFIKTVYGVNYSEVKYKDTWVKLGSGEGTYNNCEITLKQNGCYSVKNKEHNIDKLIYPAGIIEIDYIEQY